MITFTLYISWEYKWVNHKIEIANVNFKMSYNWNQKNKMNQSTSLIIGSRHSYSGIRDQNSKPSKSVL